MLKSRLASDIPDLPRVLDALSTIMWPSMTSAEVTTSKRRTPMSFVDWASRSFDYDHPFTGGQAEIAELERWLNADTPTPSDEEDQVYPLSASPTGEHSKSGFDDDFTAFVSSSSANAVFEDDQSDSERPRVESSYASLRSLSDCGGEGEELENEDDEALPTKEEIQTTSERIFGGALWNPSPTSPNAQPISVPEGESLEDVEHPAFDLTHVLSSLEGMKAEIANIEDDTERRNAAARVALGLMYGLEGVGNE